MGLRNKKKNKEDQKKEMKLDPTLNSVKFWNKNTFRIISMFILGFCLSDCSRINQQEFESNKWIVREDPLFPPEARKRMVSDLLENHKLIDLTQKQVLQLLGPTDREDSTCLTYIIEVGYAGNVDPIYEKRLDIFIAQDLTVSSCKIEEWKAEKSQ